MKIIAIIALAAAVGGCASLSDCNKYSGSQYNNCVREFHEQDARMAAAVRGAFNDADERRARYSKPRESYTCIRAGIVTECTKNY